MFFIQGIILMLFFFISSYLVKDKINTLNGKNVVYVSYGLVSIAGFVWIIMYEKDSCKTMMELLLLQGLFLISLIDFFFKVVPNRLLLLLLVVCVVIFGFQIQCNLSVLSAFLLDLIFCIGFLSGCCLLLRKGIGMGDLKLLFVIEIYTSFTGMLQILLFGAFFAAISSVFLWVCRKKVEEKEFAFVPFLCLGYIMYLLL